MAIPYQDICAELREAITAFNDIGAYYKMRLDSGEAVADKGYNHFKVRLSACLHDRKEDGTWLFRVSWMAQLTVIERTISPNPKPPGWPNEPLCCVDAMTKCIEFMEKAISDMLEYEAHLASLQAQPKEDPKVEPERPRYVIETLIAAGDMSEVSDALSAAPIEPPSLYDIPAATAPEPTFHHDTTHDSGSFDSGSCDAGGCDSGGGGD